MRKAPEIPENVFFEGETASARKQSSKQARKTASSQTSKTASKQKRKTVSRQAGKVQVTVYLSKSSATALEALRLALIRDYDLRVPKSAIADWAIAQAADRVEEIARDLRP